MCSAASKSAITTETSGLIEGVGGTFFHPFQMDWSKRQIPVSIETQSLVADSSIEKGTSPTVFLATDIRPEEAVNPRTEQLKNSTRHLTSQQPIHGIEKTFLLLQLPGDYFTRTGRT